MFTGKISQERAPSLTLTRLITNNLGKTCLQLLLNPKRLVCLRELAVVLPLYKKKKTSLKLKSMSSFKCKFIISFLLSFSYKHTKIEFDKRMQKIVSRIKNLREEVVQLNRLVNKRNGSIVKEIAEHIDNMISKYILTNFERRDHWRLGRAEK
jgi:hypothetical protein